MKPLKDLLAERAQLEQRMAQLMQEAGPIDRRLIELRDEIELAKRKESKCVR